MYEIPHLRVNVDVQNKMAAGSDSIYDEFDGVRKALDEEFGEDISKLDDLKDFMKKTEDYDGILRYKISQCHEDMEEHKGKADSVGKEQIQQIGKLLEDKNAIEETVSYYLNENNKYFATLRQFNQGIEEINCLQVYLSWIAQVTHLSSELKSELKSGHLEIAMEFFNSISDIAKRVSMSKCQNLVDYVTSLTGYWFKVLCDILESDMDATLVKMKWPFPTGISSPAISEKSDDDVLSHFESNLKLLLKLNSHDAVSGSADDERCLILTDVLVKPLQRRFSFHFYGARRTNNLEKPEWYFTQVLNWIRDHSPFLDNFVQPIADSRGFQDHYIQHEFIQALVETCREKVKNSVGQILANKSLLSHLIDETLLFDRELKSIFGYPTNLTGCTSVLLMQPYFDHWISLEGKRGTETINQLLSSNEVFTSNFDDFGTDSGLKVPYSVENIVTYISLITEKYRSFKDANAQLKFVDLQLQLLGHFISRVKDMSSLESTSLDVKRLFAILNGCQFTLDVLYEWADEVFFIQLYCAKSQIPLRADLGDQTITRLDDSIIEEYADISIGTVSEQHDSFLEHGLFDDVISSIDQLISSLTETILKSFEKDFLKKLASYKSERWHCMPSSQDIITQMVSDAACGLLMIVKETVQSMQNGLCPAIFVKFWQNYAKLIDSHIYHQVVLANHFNEGGALQLKYDVTKNLFILFEVLTSKPENFFKMSRDSCILLNLLPGSAVLLRDILVTSQRKSTGTQRDSILVNSLLDIGVKYISPENALGILNSRVDWPKI